MSSVKQKLDVKSLGEKFQASRPRKCEKCEMWDSEKGIETKMLVKKYDVFFGT